MQSDLPEKTGRPPAGVESFFGQHVDFQPLKICPRNFVIFDRTDNRSQIMYHPAWSPGAGFLQENMIVRNDKNAPREGGSLMKEDSGDIDLLLSFEEEEEEEDLSTARTQRNDVSDTADSCSSRPRKSRLSFSSSSSSSSCHKSCDGEKKRQKMKKMVNSLRGIVPGGTRMSTVGVLDEAVKYLKSLKVELEKGDMGNLKN